MDPELRVGPTQEVMRQCRVWIKFERLARRSDGQLIPPCLQCHIRAKRGDGDGEWIAPIRSFDVMPRLGVPSKYRQELRIPLVSDGVLGREFDGAKIGALSALPIPVVALLHVCERHM